MFYYVYILRSLKDKKLYIGYTENLDERIKKHNDGANESTRNRRLFKLIFAEAFIDEIDARKRERFFKTGHGREDLQKILNNTLVKGRPCQGREPAQLAGSHSFYA
ncbi:MAG: GIY-YIG nuclease superfamily protein [Parcubacteria group bacterium ADurb.Bin316]|nr:MAG: GIY-YIG nuclease superfamily protein [Parcubacteria group bacterium ADurb.Bin316]HOZ55690.1 GIY-YIG nuclease family protein [bacterium]